MCISLFLIVFFLLECQILTNKHIYISHVRNLERKTFFFNSRYCRTMSQSDHKVLDARTMSLSVAQYSCVTLLAVFFA